jgi:hypothetical protein
MLKQIFRKNVSPELIFTLLEKICLKTDKYYYIDANAFKKMIFHNYHVDFLKELEGFYHTSKQFYLSREFTYNSFTNILRQICKSNAIMFTSQIKYNESKYNIDYFIYF